MERILGHFTVLHTMKLHSNFFLGDTTINIQCFPILLDATPVFPLSAT
jgi:hypothetical protein